MGGKFGGVTLLGEDESKLDRKGVDGMEEGGSGNLDNPRLIVLSAIPEALVSRETRDTCRTFKLADPGVCSVGCDMACRKPRKS